MRVTSLNDVVPGPRRIAVGQFDGVHIGHRAVIEGSDTVLTFDPHPLRVLAPSVAPKLLTSLEIKAELVGELGVRELVVIPFDRAFAHQSAQEFIDHVLLERLGATEVAVGENFRFGHQAAGDATLLASDGRFETRVVRLIDLDGEIVSSSRVRALISAGDVGRAARFLGAPFKLRGVVVTGERRGRELGFPTANIVPDEALVCPAHGIYAARTDGACAAVSIGVRPTFGRGNALLVEAFLLDRDDDLYGRTLTIDFIERLRGEEHYDSAPALIEQMHRDVLRTRELCE